MLNGGVARATAQILLRSVNCFTFFLVLCMGYP